MSETVLIWSTIAAASLSFIAACLQWWDYKGQPRGMRIEWEWKGRKHQWTLGKGPKP